MLAWTVTETWRGGAEPCASGTMDPEPFCDTVLFEEETSRPGSLSPISDRAYRFELTLVDWASSVEIETIIIDSVSAMSLSFI